jgi:DNA invertase Pin-like site-specific DNA recombinase
VALTPLIRPERDVVRGMNALSESEITEIVAKVGRPRSTDTSKIALDLDRVQAMLSAGFSLRQIAEYFDVGISTVSRRIQEGQSNLQVGRPRWPL